MAKMLEWHDALAERTLALARTSQAFAIEVADRMARRRGPDRWSDRVPLEALLDAGREWVGEPREFIDRTYDVTARLVELHREFAHRLLDTLDQRDPGARLGGDGCSEPEGELCDDGRVIRFPSRRSVRLR